MAACGALQALGQVHHSHEVQHQSQIPCHPHVIGYRQPVQRPLRRCSQACSAHKSSPPPARALATEPQQVNGGLTGLVAAGAEQQQPPKQQPWPPEAALQQRQQQEQQQGPPPPEAEQQAHWPWLDQLTIGKLSCLSVALLWGSYSPALRLVYSMDNPPGPVAVMLFRGVLQAMVLLSADAIFSGRIAAAAASEGHAWELEEQQQQQQQAGKPALVIESPAPDAARPPPPSRWAAWLEDNLVVVGGLELGMYNFMAAAMQSFGLQLTSATKAGFLIASTSLLTPTLATLLGDRPSRGAWAGSAIALAGTLLIAADRAAPDAGGAGAGGIGDAAILAAALFYSLATVRLSSYARRVPPVRLAAAKSVVLGRCGGHSSQGAGPLHARRAWHVCSLGSCRCCCGPRWSLQHA